MKLLIGFDGSPHCLTALHDLGNAGLPESGEAVLLSLADLFLPPGPPDAPFNAVEQNAMVARHDAEHRRDALLAEARDAAVRLRETLPGWTVRAEADIDAPAWGLLKHADDWKPDLIALGAPRSSRLERLFFGSICEKVVSHARCSIRVGRTEGHGRPLKLMLAMDGSPDAHAAAEAIAVRKWPAGTEVIVVAVRDSRFSHFAESLMSPVYGEPGDGLLDGLVARFTAAGLKASAIIRDGVPKEVLIAATAENGIHCLFAGAGGMTGLERLFLGSVSSALVARAACSVEIVRRPPQS